jgi:hypothetical protein
MLSDSMITEIILNSPVLHRGQVFISMMNIRARIFTQLYRPVFFFLGGGVFSWPGAGSADSSSFFGTMAERDSRKI